MSGVKKEFNADAISGMVMMIPIAYILLTNRKYG
jgi:hypothetical protein